MPQPPVLCCNAVRRTALFLPSVMPMTQTAPPIPLELLNVVPAPHELLYLAKSGSQLFGTQTPTSDLDVKGIFLPTQTSLLLQHAPEHFTQNTNHSASGQKNAADDVDVTVWSLQFWAKILRKADMNAISLLFSWTHPQAVFAATTVRQQRFAQALAELEPTRVLSRNLSGMMGYVYSQAMRYSEKGKHYKALAVALAVLQEVPAAKMHDAAPEILARAVATLGDAAKKMIYLGQNRNNQPQIHILEKVFDLGVDVAWALPPLQALYDQYGARARAASLAQGVDFKAFSHSFRVLDEIASLHQTGRIRYPLHNAEFLRDVKLGRFEHGFLIDALDARFAEVQALETQSMLATQPDPGYLDDFIVACYHDIPA
jgi:hypothetical protein